MKKSIQLHKIEYKHIIIYLQICQIILLKAFQLSHRPSDVFL